MDCKSEQRKLGAYRAGRCSLLGIIFAACLPIFIIAINVGYITHSDWLYTYNWWRNGIPDRTGLPIHELDSAADQIKEYFLNDAERLDVRVNTLPRHHQPIRRARNTPHDRREGPHADRIRRFHLDRHHPCPYRRIRFSDLAANSSGPLLSRWLRWCALIWGIAIAAIITIAIIDFTWIFTQFHLLSFANDLWQLDPYRHYLLLLFPERFFLEATLFIALLTIIEFIGLYVGSRLTEIRFSTPHS